MGIKFVGQKLEVTLDTKESNLASAESVKMVVSNDKKTELEIDATIVGTAIKSVLTLDVHGEWRRWARITYTGQPPFNGEVTKFYVYKVGTYVAQ